MVSDRWTRTSNDRSCLRRRSGPLASSSTWDFVLSTSNAAVDRRFRTSYCNDLQRLFRWPLSIRRRSTYARIRAVACERLFLPTFTRGVFGIARDLLILFQGGIGLGPGSAFGIPFGIL